MTARHMQSEVYQEGQARKVQYEAAANSQLTLGRSFYVYGEELERVEVFKYLGRLLAYDDNDNQAIRSNL